MGTGSCPQGVDLLIQLHSVIVKEAGQARIVGPSWRLGPIPPHLVKGAGNAFSYHEESNMLL